MDTKEFFRLCDNNDTLSGVDVSQFEQRIDMPELFLDQCSSGHLNVIKAIYPYLHGVYVGLGISIACENNHNDVVLWLVRQNMAALESAFYLD